MLSVASATVGSLTVVLLWLFGWRVSTTGDLNDTDKTAHARYQGFNVCSVLTKRSE